MSKHTLIVIIIVTIYFMHLDKMRYMQCDVILKNTSLYFLSFAFRPPLSKNRV